MLPALLIQGKSLLLPLQFLRPLNVEHTGHSVFHFQKNSYWDKSHSLVSYDWHFVRVTCHLLFRTKKTQRPVRPRAFDLFGSVATLFFHCVLGRMENPHFIKCQKSDFTGCWPRFHRSTILLLWENCSLSPTQTQCDI